jgi:hypothetical protein
MYDLLKITAISMISLIPPDRSIDKSPFMKFSHEKIETVKLEIIADKLTNLEERRRYFYYYIFREFNTDNLTVFPL